MIATSSLTVRITSHTSLNTPSTPKRQTFYSEDSHEAYEEIGELGNGGFSVVLEVSTPRKVRRVAMKIPYFNQAEEAVSAEVAMLKRIQEAPHVIQYRGDFKLSHRYFKDDNGNVCICPEDKGEHSHVILTDVLSTPDAYEMFMRPATPSEGTKLTCAQILDIGMQGIETLRYLQSQKLAHRDLKPENIAYNEKTKELTICDFGGAIKVDEIDPRILEGTTLSYRTPEQMLSMPYDASVDEWGLALTLCALYTGFPLITIEETKNFDLTTVDYFHAITENLGPLPATFIQKVSLNCRHLFKKDGSIAYPPSRQTSKNLKYFALMGEKVEKMQGKKMPIWKARIHYAAYLKGEKPADAENLIAFLEPMLRYENRTLPNLEIPMALRRKGESPTPLGLDPANYLSNCGQKLAASYRSGESPSLKERVLQTSAEHKI